MTTFLLAIVFRERATETGMKMCWTRHRGQARRLRKIDFHMIIRALIKNGHTPSITWNFHAEFPCSSVRSLAIFFLSRGTRGGEVQVRARRMHIRTSARETFQKSPVGECSSVAY